MFGYDWPRLHALLNDLPIPLLVTAVFFDLVALVTGRTTLRQVSFWTLVLGAIGGVAAVLSGLQAEEHIAHGEAVHRIMTTHEKFGLITLAIFGVLALWRIVRERRMGNVERAIIAALSVAGMGFLIATGFYGGRLVFEHAAGIPDAVLQAELHDRAEGHHHHGESTPASAADSSPVEPSAGHVDPPGTPPHSHPPGTPPHRD